MLKKCMAVLCVCLYVCVIFSACNADAEGKTAMGAENSSAEDDLFSIADFGPKDFLSSEVTNPSIFVIFSQPVIPIAALGSQSATSDIMTITPPIKGVFRWYGTRYLSFEAQEPCQSQQVYTVQIKPSLKSFAGEILSGQDSFTFETEQLSLVKIVPGDDYTKRTGIFFEDTEVPPEAAQTVSLLFNYPISASDIKKYIEITASGSVKKFSASQAEENRIVVYIQDKIDFMTTLAITLKQGAKSAAGTLGTKKDAVYTYSTVSSFIYNDNAAADSSGTYSNPVDISFSHPLNAATVLQSLSTDPPMALHADNIEVNGSWIRLYNLPVTYKSVYTIKIAPQLEDIYGRKLNREVLCKVTVPDARSSAVFLDQGNKMLEAQYAQKLFFEYQNTLEDSWYRVANVRNPLSSGDIGGEKKEVSVAKENTRLFETIDLKPLLNADGKGFIAFQAHIALRQRKSERRYEMTNRLNVQVTDLGITVRIGFNRAVVLVTSLSDGKPVAGAQVHLLAHEAAAAQIKDSDFDITSIYPFASGVTDKNGFAVIPIAEGEYTRALGKNGASNYVYVVSGSDKAIFKPQSHNMYRYGIAQTDAKSVQQENAYTFLFSDRGLYKPGETISVRGVDRSLLNGVYAIYTGEYTLTLKEYVWKGKTIASITNTLSGSGTFSEKIQLPHDIPPGTYVLSYKRAHEADESGYIIITVAYFQRLKFQASIASPPMPLISGDTIRLMLSASYLSGGSVSGSSFTENWYREASYFNPKTAETKNYRFGPSSVYERVHNIASYSGMLSADGTGRLAQKTGDESIIGSPYIYKVESVITDVSNQSIAVQKSVLVHPASYYIGIAKPKNISGFPKKGQVLQFDYMIATPQGNKVRDMVSLIGSAQNQMTVQLIRTQWNVVKQQGYGGAVYDQYVQEEVIEHTQKLPLKTAGTITVTPPKAGMYTLRVSAADHKGKKVLSEYGFYATGSDGGYWNMGNASELRLTADQGEYNPGETAHILLESPLPAGTYLITIEREGIISEEVRRFDSSMTVIDVPITEEYVPVVYLSVSSYSVRTGPPNSTYGNPDLDKPKGYYGVLPLYINPSIKSFAIDIESDKKNYRPGEKVTMTLSATQGGKPLENAELTFMAVDRGVLDLINYHVNDPISYFYDAYKFPIAVSGGDSRSLLMDPVTYEIKNLLGGDSEANEEKLEERKNFDPTAVFEPVLITGKDGKVTCTFTLPDTLTTYRLTAFGVQGDYFALKESELVSQNNINVSEVLPRMLRERDKAEVGVLITNLDDTAHTVSVSLAISDPLQSTVHSYGAKGLSVTKGKAHIGDTKERTLSVHSGESKVAYFEINAETEGFISLHFTVTSDILNEKLITELQIEKPYVFETVSTTGVLGAKEVKQSEYISIPSFSDTKGTVSITLDATRLGLLDEAISYLFYYPYGCLEQRSAAIMPLVIFGKHIDVFNLKSEVDNPEAIVINEMKQWAKLQRPDGGFPYWSSGTDSDIYVSLRIAHIYAIAKENGITVPREFQIDRLLNYLKKESYTVSKQTHSSISAYHESYIQYVLSLFKEKVDTAALAALVKTNPSDICTLSFAGMTYSNLNKKAEAKECAKTVRNLLTATTRGVDIASDNKNRFAYYGGKTEQLALMLQFFVTQYPNDEINTRLLYELLETKRSRGYWDNTAVTARVLSAIDAVIKADKLEKTDVVSSAWLDSSQLFSSSFKGLASKPETQVFDFSQEPIVSLAKDHPYPLDITKTGTGAIYYTLSMKYALPAEKHTYRDEGLGLFTLITDYETGKEITDGILTAGTIYRATVRLSSGKDRTYVALRFPIPSGAEILDASFVTTPSDKKENDDENEIPLYPKNWVSNQTIFNNEIQYFWDTFYKGSATVDFLFRTARRGVYPTPPVQAECMYEPEIFGRTNGFLYRIN